METECFNEKKITQLKEKIEDVSADSINVFKALGHEKRLQVYQLLKEEACCVCDLAHAFEAPVSTISQHLKVLKNAGLISSKNDGKFLIYSVTNLDPSQILKL